MGCGLDGRGLIPGRVKIFPLLLNVLIDSRALPAFFPMDTVSYFAGGKETAA
jgi:hypothetical protein